MRNLLLIAVLMLSMGGFAQARFEKVAIKTIKLTESTYMLEGAGGNILIQVGDKELLMIDSQYAPLSERIKNAIISLSDLPISYLVNTHHHGDHTGGNAYFNSDETVVIAQAKAINRIEKENNDRAALPEKAIEEQMTLSLSAGNALLIHVHNAHTDGDLIIYLIEQNVVHVGDVYINGKYPFIDINSGGSIRGYLAAQKMVLALVNDDTIIVPGHGAVSNYGLFSEYHNLLQEITAAVQERIDLNESREDIVKDSSITNTYDKVGYGDGFITAIKFRETLYDSLKGAN
jgi:glyoxylase-like metal-dependent hydrolase (beta-lactamase superfamily II)